jgi:hypothetical protein
MLSADRPHPRSRFSADAHARRADRHDIELDCAFYPAEPYHQDYLTRHPGDPYIAFHDLPKIEDLKRLFPDVSRQQPVLVGTGK